MKKLLVTVIFVAMMPNAFALSHGDSQHLKKVHLTVKS